MLVSVIVAAVVAMIVIVRVAMIVIVRVVMSLFMRMVVSVIMSAGGMVVSVTIIVPVVMTAGMVAAVMPFLRSMFDVLVNLAAVTVLVVTATAVRVAFAIGAGLGLEWRIDLLDRGTQAFEHIRQHVIGSDAQIAVADFDRHVAIAEVIGGARQFAGIVAGDVRHLLVGGNDFDHAAVARDDHIAAAQQVATRQVEADLLAGRELRAQAALLARLERQTQLPLGLDGIGSVGDFQFLSDFKHRCFL